MKSFLFFVVREIAAGFGDNDDEGMGDFFLLILESGKFHICEVPEFHYKTPNITSLHLRFTFGCNRCGSRHINKSNYTLVFLGITSSSKQHQFCSNSK